MNPVAVKYGAAPLASVNLVPKDIQERRKLRAVQFTAGVAVLIAVAAIVLGFLAALGTQAAAQAGLNDALARQDAAIAERDAKAPVYYSYVDRENAEFALTQAGYGEISYDQFTTAIANTADANTSFDTIDVHGPSALGFGGSTQDSIFGSSVGSIEFAAHSVSAEEANDFISRLEAVPGVASVRATAEAFITDDGDVFWKVEGVALVTPTVLTMRIVPTESITGIDALTMVTTQGTDTPGVAPSPDPTVSPSPSASPTAESEG